MRAAVCNALGPPESIVVSDVPELSPGKGEALVKVHAASVNFSDVLIIAGKYQVPVPVPFTPGSEFAGEVVAVGEHVDTVRLGDRVFGSVMAGAFAERVVAGAAGLNSLPPPMTFAEAAATGVVYTTAYHSLRSVAEVTKGDWVVVLGAAGGVGLATVDLAQLLGGRVIAAASSPEKLALCRERGAEEAIDYLNEDLRARIREITGPGADVVIDNVGGDSAERALRALRWGGRFVTVGYASGEIPRIPLNLVMLKGVIVKGFEIRNFAEHDPAAAERDRRELRALMDDGSVHPYIGATYPLEQVTEALRHVADRRALGKVVVAVQP